MRFEFSAGGVVFKNDPKLQILVSKHSYHHGWVFPKGLIGDNPSVGSKHGKEAKSASAKGFGETKEEAAIREVKEETGAEAKIIEKLTPVTYWYQQEVNPKKSKEKEKIKKTVYYFLMEYTGGDISQHDDEMEEVEWLDPEEVEKRLTYPSDKKVWKESMKILNL